MKSTRSTVIGFVRGIRILFVGLTALLAGSVLQAQDVITQIDNLAHWAYSNGPENEAASLLPFAEPGRFAIGESFVVPAGTNNIESLAMWIKPSLAVSDLHLKIYLARWDPVASRIMGSLHSWEGPDWYYYLVFPPTAPGFYGLYFDTQGQAPARAGMSYMVFMTADEFLPADPQTPKFGYIPAGAYDDGSAWTVNGSSFADLDNAIWDRWSGDLAFAVQFTPGQSPSLPPVPEPATYGLVAGCLLAALGILRRMRTGFGHQLGRTV